MILFAAVGGLMLSSVPSAFANSPTLQGAPTAGIVRDTQGTVEIIANAFGNGIRQIGVVEGNPGNVLPLVVPNVAPLCPNDFSSVSGYAGKLWVLKIHSSDPKVPGTYAADSYVGVNLAASQQKKASIPFGPTNGPFTINDSNLENPATDDWTVGSDTTNAGTYSIQSGNLVVYWAEVPGNLDTASTHEVGNNWRVLACGTENNIDDIWRGPMLVILPVGGMVLPVSMTTLFVAGISSSAIWLVPLTAAAGGAFAILRYQLRREQNES